MPVHKRLPPFACNDIGNNREYALRWLHCTLPFSLSLIHKSRRVGGHFLHNKGCKIFQKFSPGGLKPLSPFPFPKKSSKICHNDAITSVFSHSTLPLFRLCDVNCKSARFFRHLWLSPFCALLLPWGTAFLYTNIGHVSKWPGDSGCNSFAQFP